VDIKSVSEALGHYSAAFTLDQYASVTNNIRKENAAKLDAYITRIHMENK